MTETQCENAKSARTEYEAREREEKHMRFMCAALTGILANPYLQQSLTDSGLPPEQAGLLTASTAFAHANLCMRVLDDAKGGDA